MRATFLILLLFFGFSFFNCTSTDCDFGPVHEYFDISGISQVSHVKTDFSYHEESTDLSFEEYSHMELLFDVIYISSLNRHSSLINNSWLPSLYGCSPPRAGFNGSKEEAYNQFSIVTMNDYNDTIVAGDNINHLIELSDLTRFDGYVSVEEYLSSIEDKVPVELIYIKPTIGPSSGEDFRLKILVDLTTGESFEIEAAPITFR